MLAEISSTKRRSPYKIGLSEIKNQKLKILIAPLDWGLGHATRCIPIIRYLQETGRAVVLAADGRPRLLLEAEFPDLPVIPFPGYDIRYPIDGAMVAAMARQFPKILRGIWKEYRWLNKWVEQERPALIISDNRFGLFHKTVPSVYITHQLNIKTPPAIEFLQPLFSKLHTRVIERFNECWIPDYETSPGLAGELSHASVLPRNAKYIGPLSRFEKKSSQPRQINLYDENIDLLVILSGPEPQRSIFEEIILAQLPKTGLRALVVEGRSEEDSDEWVTDRVRVVSRMTSLDLKTAIEKSTVVLARPGYSTVMDIAVLGKPTIFVPTPGQTEQEYLGNRLATDWGSVVVKQNEFDLKRAWKEIQGSNYPIPVTGESISFIPHLENLLNR